VGVGGFSVGTGSRPSSTRSASSTPAGIGILCVAGSDAMPKPAPIEQITTTSSGATAVFLVANQTGVQGVFSSSGATDELAVYSPYGKQTIKSGSDVTPFGFQGSYTDSTGLIYLINRYYDPSTDQFLSVDPDVATTDQPYVFTNDDPLNAEDPLGCEPVAAGGNTNADTPAVAKALAKAKTSSAAQSAKANEDLATKIIKILNNDNFSTSGTAAGVYHQIVQDTSTPFDAITATQATKIVEDLGVGAAHYAAAVTAIGGALTYYNDVETGDSPSYAAGDATFTLGGAFAGAALCGGPEDGVGIACGVIAGFFGGSLGHDIWNAIS
jgi:RHS repeat-associated protein